MENMVLKTPELNGTLSQCEELQEVKIPGEGKEATASQKLAEKQPNGEIVAICDL